MITRLNENRQKKSSAIKKVNGRTECEFHFLIADILLYIDIMPISSTEVLRKGLVVTDTIYNPKETKLLREAKVAGCITFNGTGMLAYQGAVAFKLFTGAEMPVEEIRSLFFN